MNLPDLHLLRAAIVLAEVCNYSRASKKLKIQQPTLTKWILELEHEVGVQLFNRSTQFVEPTDACRKLVEEARLCLFHAERAIQVARMADRGAQTILHIGKSQYTDPYLISVMTSISLPLFPNLELSLSSMATTELETEVLLGRLDVAVAIGEFGNPKITQLELMRSPFYVVFPESSDLSYMRALTLDALDKRTWVLFERHVQPALYDEILRVAGNLSAKPRFVHHVVTAEEAAQELHAGTGEAAFLTRAGAWRIARNGLAMRPLEHPELVLSTKLIARADDPSRVVSEFARTLRKKLDAFRRVQLNLQLIS